jgi:Phage integrase family
MRHSAATLALDEGVALAVVQELLGHSDICVTRGYTHVSSLLAQDAARVGRALFGEVLPKLLPRTMIHKASRGFPLVRWALLRIATGCEHTDVIHQPIRTHCRNMARRG